MTNYMNLLKQLSPDKIIQMIIGGAVPCSFCIGCGLPEMCEKDGLNCEDGIKIWLESEVDNE